LKIGVKARKSLGTELKFRERLRKPIEMPCVKPKIMTAARGQVLYSIQPEGASTWGDE
jgi:hypothetical protein